MKHAADGGRTATATLNCKHLQGMRAICCGPSVFTFSLFHAHPPIGSPEKGMPALGEGQKLLLLPYVAGQKTETETLMPTANLCIGPELPLERCHCIKCRVCCHGVHLLPHHRRLIHCILPAIAIATSVFWYGKQMHIRTVSWPTSEQRIMPCMEWSWCAS